jgi:hypothetical protein
VQSEAFVQGTPSLLPPTQIFVLQEPEMVVHCASELHCRPAGLLQAPQSVSNRQTVFPALLHLPTSGQSVFLVQAMLVLTLQWPPWIGQSLLFLQTPLSMLQRPTLPQSAAVLQAAPVTLHAPGNVGQLALLVHAAFDVLHVPGSGVHTGGAQVGIAVQGFSSEGGRRLQPGGL